VPNDEQLWRSGGLPLAMASLHHAHLFPRPLSFSHAQATAASSVVDSLVNDPNGPPCCKRLLADQYPRAVIALC
jgi:hypothetical protein